MLIINGAFYKVDENTVVRACVTGDFYQADTMEYFSEEKLIEELNNKKLVKEKMNSANVVAFEKKKYYEWGGRVFYTEDMTLLSDLNNLCLYEH